MDVELQRGLYQFSVIADAREFNWDELYITLNAFGNVNQRTGPWDFNLLDGNKPLVPSYWVTLNGQSLGLWYFQRVSLEDLAHQRFRGRMAFYAPEAKPYHLEFVPYRPMKLRWMSARLENDPDDRLEPLPFAVAGVAGKCPAAAWASPEYWRERRERLATTHALYAEPLRRAFDWACGEPSSAPTDLARKQRSENKLPLLLAAWRLGDRSAARNQALDVIDRAVAQPHWGNPNPDGYGHNGDMGAANVLLALAWAWQALPDALGEPRREQLLAKLALQGDRFFEQALLHRDYWGGSVLQDHGWQSMFRFGTAALALLGVLPQAELWCEYAVPRIRRGLDAMPRDGVIPPSSYASPYLYLDDLTLYRDALLAAGGGDIFDRPAFHPIVDYLLTVLREGDGRMIVSMGLGGDSIPFIGGNAFLNRIAAKYRNERAVWLACRLLESPMIEFYHATQETGYYMGALWGFLSHDSSVRPSAALSEPQRLTFFEDSGLAHFRDARNNVTLSVKCGPWCGYNAYRRASGPSDRMGTAPGAGHFVVALGAQPLLVTPDGGYRLHAGLRSCLLIDGRGQHGDIGYPMSIPSMLHHGEEIQSVRWDDAAGRGVIRLNLALAYPDELGVAGYTREFILGGARRIICRDHIVLDEPRRLSWLFQGKCESGIAIENDRCVRFEHNPALRLEACGGGLSLVATVHPTEVVWSYASASGFTPFNHVRYDALSPTCVALVDFIFSW